jgi:hypothetical protein
VFPTVTRIVTRLSKLGLTLNLVMKRTIADAHEEVALSSTVRSPSLLLIGPETAIRDFLDPLMPSLAEPVVCCDGASPEFPNPPIGSLIVHDVAQLTPFNQQQLLEWMNDPNRSARVIATSSGPVFPNVARGAFSDGLYYRLNTFTFMLNNEAAAPAAGSSHARHTLEGLSAS